MKAKEFHNAVSFTAELGIRTRLLGTGEKPDDFEELNANRFVSELL